MLSNPETWILFSFILFLFLSIKKIIIYGRNFLDSYSNDIKDKINKITTDEEQAELNLQEEQKRVDLIEKKILALQHSSAEKAREIKNIFKDHTTKLSERTNNQYELDMAIELKFEKKLLVKNLCKKITDNLIKNFKNEPIVNVIDIESLDLNKLLNEKK